MKLNTYNYVEYQEQVDALEEFAPNVREILRGYRKKRQLSAIATSLIEHGIWARIIRKSKDWMIDVLREGKPRIHGRDLMIWAEEFVRNNVRI